jgi:hypothetical protein
MEIFRGERCIRRQKWELKGLKGSHNVNYMKNIKIQISYRASNCTGRKTLHETHNKLSEHIQDQNPNKISHPENVSKWNCSVGKIKWTSICELRSEYIQQRSLLYQALNDNKKIYI